MPARSQPGTVTRYEGSEEDWVIIYTQRTGAGVELESDFPRRTAAREVGVGAINGP